MDKCLAILEMKSPNTVKEVQQLTIWIIAFSRFLSKSVKWADLFFKITEEIDEFLSGQQNARQFFRS